MQTLALKRLCVVHNLEKEPLKTGRIEPDVSAQLDSVVRWSFRISFSLLVLFFVGMVGMIAYGIGQIITVYGRELSSL